MPIRLKALVLCAVVWSLPAVLRAAEAPAPLPSAVPSAGADTVTAEWLAQADRHYAGRADLAEVRTAQQLLTEAVAVNPENFDAWWRLARCDWWLGDHVPKAERAAWFEKGQVAAEQAIRLRPDRVEGHYWQGVNLGRLGEERGIFNSLFMVDPIAKAMEATLEIDPQHAKALYVLSALYRKAPGWPLSRGDMQKSLAYARQAVENGPEFVITHVGLAETLMALNQKEEAKRELELALELPGPADEQPETAEDKKTAEDLLSKLK